MLRKLLTIVLSIVTLGNSMVLSVSANEMQNAGSRADVEDEQVFHEITEEEEFVPGSVIVVIKREYSGLDKTFSENDFPGVIISKIEYLTPLISN